MRWKKRTTEAAAKDSPQAALPPKECHSSFEESIEPQQPAYIFMIPNHECINCKHYEKNIKNSGKILLVVPLSYLRLWSLVFTKRLSSLAGH